MSNEKNQRRDFLKTGVLGLLAATVAARVGLPEQAFAQAGQDVKETDGNAKALGYHEDAKKAKRVAKAGVAPEKQFCHNCMFYQGKGDAAAIIASEKAPCTLFASKNVKGKGYCNSWAPNPKVKA